MKIYLFLLLFFVSSSGVFASRNPKAREVVGKLFCSLADKFKKNPSVISEWAEYSSNGFGVDEIKKLIEFGGDIDQKKLFVDTYIKCKPEKKKFCLRVLHDVFSEATEQGRRFVGKNPSSFMTNLDKICHGRFDGCVDVLKKFCDDISNCDLFDVVSNASAQNLDTYLSNTAKEASAYLEDSSKLSEIADIMDSLSLNGSLPGNYINADNYININDLMGMESALGIKNTNGSYLSRVKGVWDKCNKLPIKIVCGPLASISKGDLDKLRSGGNTFKNEGELFGKPSFPTSPGNYLYKRYDSSKYVELDVNFNPRGGKRGADRIVYHKETGEVFLTNDHYRSGTYLGCFKKPCRPMQEVTTACASANCKVDLNILLSFSGKLGLSY